MGVEVAVEVEVEMDGVTTKAKWTLQMWQECSIAVSQQMLSGACKCCKNAQ